MSRVPFTQDENKGKEAFKQKPAKGIVEKEAAKNRRANKNPKDGKITAKTRAKMYKSQKDVKSASEFDYGNNSKQDKAAGQAVAQNKEANYLIKNKGMDKGEVYADIAKRQEQGLQVNDRLQNRMNKYNERQEMKADRKAGRAEARAAAKEKAGTIRKPQPANPAKPQPGYGGSMLPSETNTTGDFSVGRDLNQNVGKTGDMTTTVTDSTFGAGASVGNDYSVTIGNNQAGNSSGDGGGGGGSNNPLSNMQATAAYNALNNNQLARSRSELNGYGRAAGAVEEAEKQTGAGQRVANLYNAVGANQEYLQKKQKEVQDTYLGNMEGFSTEFVLPEAPAPVDLDPAKDIYEDAMDELD